MTQRLGRIPLVDHIRGVAVIGMIIFHGGWDLGIFHIIEPSFLSHWAWLWFSYIIAGSFIFISGAAQYLAESNGQTNRQFWMRFLKIAGAAALVTVATLIVYPESYIFFGILHHIAAASIVLLLLRSLPNFLLILFALIVLSLQHFFNGGIFDQPWLLWIGLASYFPNTNDYVPLFPWLGLGLLGMVTARIVYATWGRVGPAVMARPAAPGLQRGLHGLEWLGRHSLAIYLIHQPVLWGLAYMWATYVMDPNAF